MTDNTSLTITDLLAASTQCLENAGYTRIEADAAWDFNKQAARLFEDEYNIVAVVVYGTWRDLVENWGTEQAGLVELISRHMSSNDAKAWDGYLVLLTPSRVGEGERDALVNIRYNTSRLRKLVASGEELTVLADVEHVLLPLLPLRAQLALGERPSVLSLLPELLAAKGLPVDAVNVLISAFEEQRPLLESLHAFRNPK